MENQHHHFSSPRKENIFYQCWLPTARPRAVVLLVHGLAEHSGRYAELAAHFTGRGYAVYALDLPGHGRSQGRPGYIDQFSDYLDTVTELLALVQQQHPDLPRFLLGHSMGGLICANYLLRDQHAFSGVILSGPAIMSVLKPPAIQLMLIRLLARITPKLGVLQLDANGVSRDPAVVKNYVEDPLNYIGKISTRSVRELFSAMEQVQQGASQITLPVLLLHGAEDSMAAPEGSRYLHQHIGSQDKTLHIYPELYHEIFNEPERDAIFSVVLQWLDERTGG